MNKLIVNLAPTGNMPTQEINRHVPLTAAEIVEDVLRCAEQGVSMVHLHARDNHGRPTYSASVFAEIISGIRKRRDDLILVVTTSGRNFPDFAKRSEVLQLTGAVKPDMASLTLSSMNFMQGESVNSPETIVRLAETMKDNGIKPELEVFDLGMINFAKYLIRKGLLVPPYYFNILLGNIAGAQATLLHAGLILAELPPDSYCSITGLGSYQHAMNALAVIAADGVRVGLEDNVWWDREKGVPATNAMLVNRVAEFARLLGREMAKPAEVRQWLDLDVRTVR